MFYRERMVRPRGDESFSSPPSNTRLAWEDEDFMEKHPLPSDDYPDMEEERETRR